jgi:hypothetical protein
VNEAKSIQQGSSYSLAEWLAAQDLQPLTKDVRRLDAIAGSAEKGSLDVGAVLMEEVQEPAAIQRD